MASQDLSNDSSVVSLIEKEYILLGPNKAFCHTIMNTFFMGPLYLQENVPLVSESFSAMEDHVCSNIKFYYAQFHQLIYTLLL